MLQWLNKKKFFVLAIASIFALWGCESKVPPMEYFPDMQDSFAIESQEADYFSPQNSGSRIPPVGTIARDYHPYPFKGTAISEELPGEDKGLKNPIKKTKENFVRGEQRYHIYCYPCHGARGEGNGPVIGPEPKFPVSPPSFLAEKIRKMTDGQIYHTITMGRGNMSNYAYQIEPDDRWKIIHYIRGLQSAGGK